MRYRQSRWRNWRLPYATAIRVEQQRLRLAALLICNVQGFDHQSASGLPDNALPAIRRAKMISIPAARLLITGDPLGFD